MARNAREMYENMATLRFCFLELWKFIFLELQRVSVPFLINNRKEIVENYLNYI